MQMEVSHQPSTKGQSNGGLIPVAAGGQLLKSSWRLHLQTASAGQDTEGGKAVNKDGSGADGSKEASSEATCPIIMLDLKVQDQACRADGLPTVRDTQLELSKENLQTILAGLGKIRDQLALVTDQPKG
mmetsp:Transcript_11241/g.16562  ORF Transcript_11241/g.16562 Transcript_11241/m.16562 type:complete len:129 (-) Transcript_11241:206-592(-)|eukprot:CAMPEP_0113934142 /NCGR_PEP_ID=MMETSP1339-20121228/1472_1 /TAXON_ID=94617 /ORGANISM="Fibrocapsa japonica" /LENGTH=128 /DNA_ID=CAMNT_0000935809 /DNA_START=46 /DNA_END=432 /DNA_ORIENTATION=+ /assembly_acc=CAM_ASM_000762